MCNYKKYFFEILRIQSFLKLVFLLGMIFTFSSATAVNNFQFEHISVSEGLSNGTVHDVLRDDDGFLWICTADGLNRYDGYSIKQYKPRGISQNIIYEKILKSDDGSLWLATSLGLFCYCPEYDLLTRFPMVTQLGAVSELLNTHINSIFLDKDGQLWVGSWAGLLSIDINGKKISDIIDSDIQIYSNREYPIDNNIEVMINSFAQDSKGLIWMTSSSPRLTCYNPQDSTFSFIDIAYPPLQDMKYNLNKILIDQKDNIYIYTEGVGIVYWDRAKNTFEEFELKTSLGQKIRHGVVRSMLIDSDNKLWIGTDGYGFFIYDGSEFTQYNTERKEYSNISSDVVYSIYEDPEHNMWLGTYLAGLNKLSKSKTNFGLVPKSLTRDSGLSGKIVFNFLEDHKGYVWVATDGGGLNRINPKTNNYKHYFPDPSKKNAISTKTTIALFQDHNHDIWIGSYNGGLNRYNYATDDFTTFYNDPNDSNSICSNHPWGFAEDKYGNLWIASNAHGVDLKPRGSTRFINYSDDENDSDMLRILSSNALTHMIVDSRNYLWIGTEGGLNMADLNKVDFTQDRPELNFRHFVNSSEENSLSSNQISYLAEDPNGNVWIGTKGGGLNQYLLEEDSFITYTVEDGLPYNTIQGIVFDDNNRGWLSTSYGLSTFDLDSISFENFTQSDGLQDNLFIKTSCYKAKDGKLYFGGVSGFNAFYPSGVVKNNHAPQVKITSFKLFNKEVQIGEKVNGRLLIDRSITYMKQLELEHRNNFFTFEFSALDFTNAKKNQYAYMMEGFDENWIYTNSDSRKAVYTNLNPGDYTFRVKASNNNGVWNEEGASIDIKILPPWWGTWWFRLLVILWIVGSVALVFYLRVRQLRHQKEKLRIEVNERTEQLRKANESLKESNATKDKYFSIIAHDVISPFNAILGLSDLLKDRFSTLDSKQIESYIGLINRSSKQLHELLMNLLEWSRSERGVLSFNPESLDLKSIIQESIELNSFAAENKDVKLEMDVPDFHVLAFTDKQMIKTVLRNLQSNAIKFTPNGGTITVKAVVEDKFFKVSVVDSGVGMDLETQQNLFNPNDFVSTRGTNNEAGTGLGLKLVAEFVAMQGGEVWVESEVGKGSKIHFTVPVAS